MNLDLGGTIWLNPSRKLLEFHKWFFTPLDKMPKRVYREFKHHSHTHSSVVITSSSSYGSHEYRGLASKDCGYPTPPSITHPHAVTISEGDDAHTHSITVTFGSANLGSPNWWVHVHALTGTPTGSGGAAHTHTLTSPSQGNKCSRTGCTLHTHTFSYNLVNNGVAHTHTFSGNSGNSTSGQTPESHTHTFSFTTGVGDDHFHAQTITSSNATTCSLGKSHSHYLADATDTVSHNHTGSGTSGSGGESAAKLRRLLVGVGL